MLGVLSEQRGRHVRRLVLGLSQLTEVKQMIMRGKFTPPYGRPTDGEQEDNCVEGIDYR